MIKTHVLGETEQGEAELQTRATFPDADYILSKNDYDYTPLSDFKRQPIYSQFNYSALQEGDIILETNTPTDAYIGHTAMIYNVSKRGAHGNYIQTIEAVGGGVQFGFLDDTRMINYRIRMLRVCGLNLNIKAMVKYFFYAQLGKSYSPIITRLNTDINSKTWYCSELVFAAYKYAGIDIGVKKTLTGDAYLLLGCLPYDIYNSYNTYQVALNDFYLGVSILYKSGKWKLRVYNCFTSGITAYYNSKMCFTGDAKNWKNLKDIKSIYLDSGAYADVEIGENWFANSIAFSWIKDGNRLITYGINLNSKENIMDVNWATI